MGESIQSSVVLIADQSSSLKPSDWEVRLGQHDFRSGKDPGIKLEVMEIKIHPKYSPANSTHPGDYDVGKARLHTVESRE